jgi:HTH-type transcriptional regulator/antitoxin HigA
LLDEGPSLVQKLLKKYGIHYCVIPHLPKTHLDGVSCIGSDGNPVIGMTIRYDRLDNFWYTLFHELAHVFLHLSSDKESHAYIDDLQYRANNEQEQEADDFAGKELIDDSLLDAYNLFADYSAERVLASRTSTPFTLPL